jgi:hypothetical protein
VPLLLNAVKSKENVEKEFVGEFDFIAFIARKSLFLLFFSMLFLLALRLALILRVFFQWFFFLRFLHRLPLAIGVFLCMLRSYNLQLRSLLQSIGTILYFHGRQWRFFHIETFHILGDSILFLPIQTQPSFENKIS